MFSWLHVSLETRLSSRDYTYALIMFSSTVSKNSITLAWSGNIISAKYVFGEGSLHINILYMYTFWQIAYVCNPSPFAFYIIIFFHMVTFETHGHFIYWKGDIKHSNEWEYKLHWHKKRLHPTVWKKKLGGGFIRWFWQENNVLNFLWQWFSFGPNKF